MRFINIDVVKKTNIFIGITGSVLLLILAMMEEVFPPNCISDIGLCNTVHTLLISSSGPWMFFSVPFLIFSSVTYFMKDAVVKMWAAFSYVWILIALGVLSVSDKGAGGGPGHFSDAAGFFLIMIALYILLSILIILWKYISTREGK